MEGQTCFMDHVPPSGLIWVNSSQCSFFFLSQQTENWPKPKTLLDVPYKQSSSDHLLRD